MISRRRRPVLFALPLLAALLPAAQAQTTSAQTTSAQAAAPAAPCAGQLVRDATGNVCIPKAPKRIVTIEWTYSENLLALGIQPVGMADIKGFTAYVKAPTPIAASVKDVGGRGEANLETIAALKPDLIINQSGDYSQREALSKIAPTLVFNPYRPAASGDTAIKEMRDTFLLMGRITGRTAQAQRVLAALDSEAAAARRTLNAAGRGGQTFVLSQGYGGSDPAMRLFGPSSLGSQVIELTGLKNAYQPKTPEYGFNTLSLEGLTTLNTQNFFGITQRNDNVYVTNAALWNNLPFVKQGHGYALAPESWLFGGPSSARVLIAQVVAAMTGKR